MSENRVPPDQTLGVTLLTRPILQHSLRVARPAAPDCTACGRQWTDHPCDERKPWPCQRRGAEFSVFCYRGYVLSAYEPRSTFMIFLCPGCRS
jgi:hypothetical protein